MSGKIKNTWDIYPRPQLKRDSFFSLNGIWEIETDKGREEILVPFPPESKLSGYEKEILLNKLFVVNGAIFIQIYNIRVFKMLASMWKCDFMKI